MKILVAVAVIICLWLQYSLWFGQSGHFAQARLQSQVDSQRERVAVLKQRNRILTAEVMALKREDSVLEMVEARARRDLGMVKQGEVFYLIEDQQP